MFRAGYSPFLPVWTAAPFSVVSVLGTRAVQTLETFIFLIGLLIPVFAGILLCV